MRFVSVADGAGGEGLPLALQPFHVGGLEAGTARVLQRLVEPGGQRKANLGEEVREICTALRLEPC